MGEMKMTDFAREAFFLKEEEGAFEKQNKEETPAVIFPCARGQKNGKGKAHFSELSGFSPSLLKLVMNGEALKEEEVEVVMEDGTTVKEKVRVTPEQLLQKMLDDSLYDPVREILGQSTEGALSGFEWVPPVVAKDDAMETLSSVGGDEDDDDGFELM